MYLYLIQVCFLLLTGCANPENNNSGTESAKMSYDVKTIAQNLEVPWGMDFLPDGRLLFNERSGNINLLDLQTGEIQLLMQRKNKARAEGGLLGLAVDPQFEKTGWIFIYETAGMGNRIVRLQYGNNTLTEDTIIVDNIPAEIYHDGGILRFGPDGYLYAGTGDARDPQSAQDKTVYAGKILRMDVNGNAVDGNPFGNLIYSYGHRNVQGMAWDANGNMYATEHGPSGEINGWCCHDEFNQIIAGGNYGWPVVIGNDNAEGMIAPMMHSGDDTWAPGGLVYMQSKTHSALNNTFIFACLRGRKLIVTDVAKNIATQKEILFDGTYKRLRNIIQAPDGSLIFCSSNMDGRESSPLLNDDKIYLLQLK